MNHPAVWSAFTFTQLFYTLCCCTDTKRNSIYAWRSPHTLCAQDLPLRVCCTFAIIIVPSEREDRRRLDTEGEVLYSMYTHSPILICTQESTLELCKVFMPQTPQIDITAVCPCLSRLQMFCFFCWLASETFTSLFFFTNTVNLWAWQIDDSPFSSADNGDNERYTVFHLNWARGQSQNWSDMFQDHHDLFLTRIHS